ncbi:hypothetical protein ACFO0N_03315 [Halobium salinum]|uniref:DUF308 domain-containing protein n=1 Tax=Halobium salinum TaxID=1364940 RepID=A0ABD5P941_9EURY|nr:hypothetical protein [Halobium salinum]
MDTPRGDTDDPFDTGVDETTADESATGEDGSTTDDGPGVAALLILVGAGLFVFPEPVTSWVGATLVVVGALAWLTRFALG